MHIFINIFDILNIQEYLFIVHYSLSICDIVPIKQNTYQTLSKLTIIYKQNKNIVQFNHYNKEYAPGISIYSL